MASKPVPERLLGLIGFDWFGVSFPPNADRAFIAKVLEAVGVFLGDPFFDETAQRVAGVGGRAKIEANRLRLDLSGGFWEISHLSTLAPLLALEGAKLHRVDVAVEPEDGERLFKRMLKAAQRGDVGGFSRFSVVRSWMDGEPDGETLYLGSRESQSFTRFYRKKGRLRWRFEREYKRERALQVALALGVSSIQEPELKRWLFGGVVFGKRETGDRHLDRVVPFPWWTRFTGLAGYEPLPRLTPVEKSLEKSLGWIERQVAPTLRTLQVAGYSNLVRDIVAAAKPKSAVLDAVAGVDRVEYQD